MDKREETKIQKSTSGPRLPPVHDDVNDLLTIESMF